jgi:fucose 4-O-acetylase-like acetyltransferase
VGQYHARELVRGGLFPLSALGAGTSASRGSRWFVSVIVAALVAFQTAAVAGGGRTTLAVLGVHGFVVHVLLGKAQVLAAAASGAAGAPSSRRPRP